MFKLYFDIPPSEIKISLEDKLYLAGSCFSDEIGEKLSTYKFSNLHNPFGTLYNPVSLFKTVSGKLDPTNLTQSQGVYYHWDCHGSISGLTVEDVEEKVRSAIKTSAEFLDSATVLILTLGTSFVYTHRESNAIVGNCHKAPAAHFTKRLLSKEEVILAFSTLYKNLKSNLTIIFTISPVRHLRDGLVENNLSKAILLKAVHEMVNQYENAYYFPSYEIMNDELRDYRFFKDDMVHPSNQAVAYIWEKFVDVFFTDAAKEFIQDWEKLLQAMNHKPFQPTSKEHQAFLVQTLSKLNALKTQVNVSDEIKVIEEQIL